MPLWTQSLLRPPSPPRFPAWPNPPQGWDVKETSRPPRLRRSEAKRGEPKLQLAADRPPTSGRPRAIPLRGPPRTPPRGPSRQARRDPARGGLSLTSGSTAHAGTRDRGRSPPPPPAPRLQTPAAPGRALPAPCGSSSRLRRRERLTAGRGEGGGAPAGPR